MPNAPTATATPEAGTKSDTPSAAPAPGTTGPSAGEQKERETRITDHTQGTKKPRGPQPTYNVAEVGDELPTNDTAPRGRGNVYFDLLLKVTETPGKWCEVARFGNVTGANTALKALKATDEKGQPVRRIPPGDWEFDTRRLRDEADQSKRISVLYARFLG